MGVNKFGMGISEEEEKQLEEAKEKNYEIEKEIDKYKYKVIEITREVQELQFQKSAKSENHQKEIEELHEFQKKEV